MSEQDSDLIGQVCTSKAGHDKNEYYVIVSLLDNKHVGIANGRKRTIAKPKKKNLRHLHLTRKRVEEIKQMRESVGDNLKLATILRKMEDDSVKNQN